MEKRCTDTRQSIFLLLFTMPQVYEQKTDKRENDESTFERERASGNKLWSVYISEAESYDHGLIDGWRSEMDGLLLFAGLFSGVVTTFIIDSYKTLNPDSGSQTVVLLSQTVLLLSQISQQLANMNNETVMADALPPPAAFSPSVSSLVCNVLWFTSLALSLSSALVATLVKQWAQEYEHRTSMFSSPSVRSRVYMYLYYGLRRFNMHAVVGVPPLLLHAALVLFLAGLVAFLVPVNIIILAITSAQLLLFISVYGVFTALPLFFSDCPYQTPLTRILWSLNQSFGNSLRASLWKAVAVCSVLLRERVDVTDPEKTPPSAVISPDASSEPSAPAKTRLQFLSMTDAVKSAALHPPLKTETQTLAWTVRSLSDDEELVKLVEGLPQTMWDFDKNKPRSVYHAVFQSLLCDPKVHLGQRLAEFMAGSNSNLLEPTDRLRRQLSVLRAIWAICAFSLHMKSPLQSPIGEAHVDNALLGSKFLDSPDVQSMVLDVSALIRLNVIESRSREWAPTQSGSSNGDIGADAEKQRHMDMLRTYAQYLLALPKCAATFQRDVTTSLFHRSQIRCTEAGGYKILQDALRKLIEYAPDQAADNLVFAARQIITAFAQTSDYPRGLYLFGLGPFLVQHRSLAVSDPRADLKPFSKRHYTRYLCHCLCDNLKNESNPRASFDALQLIYGQLLDSPVPPRDFDTHLSVLYALRSSGVQAANIRTHRLVASVQSFALKTFPLDSSESSDLSGWEKLPSIFEDEAWFSTVIGLDNGKLTERALAPQVYGCACVGVVTTFFELCAAQSPDQTERDLDFETLNSICNTVNGISSVIPPELQCRFADAASEFINIYPKDCLADEFKLYWVLFWALNEHWGWITDLDALRVLDTAVLDVQIADQQEENQQESHKVNAERIREAALFREHLSREEVKGRSA
ncbi:unnamed protein product [Mycena citricolor]|uniref:DUF6535 domain-containing protein n=1 Tax=Mycena citricolor TaxID=2018698 RepID=A0AAD2HM44_9AGAR|nr:unnamed protein product [Mycena citricolor]